MPVMNTQLKGGGTTPTGTINISVNGVYNVSTYASADVQVPQPSGTASITNNGTYNIAQYASVEVQVPTTAPESYRVFQKNTNNKLVNSTSTPFLTLPSGTADIDEYLFVNAYKGTPSSVLSGVIDLSSLITLTSGYSCSYMFANCTGITGVNLGSLTTISGNSPCQYMFSNCSGLTSVDLSSLMTVSGSNGCNNMFANCVNLTSVNLSSLTTLSGSYALTGMFQGCRSITNINLSSLTTITGSYVFFSTFGNCSALKTVNLNSLTTITQETTPSYGYVFGGCTSLEEVYLGGLKSTTFTSSIIQIRNLFNSTTGSSAPNGCTVHFPSNFDPTDPDATFDITRLIGYPTFGGDANYIHLAFDLPATE